MAERRRLEELRIDRSEAPEESPWQRRLLLLALSVVLGGTRPRDRDAPRPRLPGAPVVVSVMAESLLLALLGGVIGGGLAWAVADGYQTATMNWQSFSQVAFSLTVTPRLLAGGIAYALAMGFLGGIFPAVGAVRTPIVAGLRQV